jgi:pimeloyl-ACP methyl ester carboxylesterase
MQNALGYDDVGSGLPVVLIHGFPLNRQMWAPQVEALSKAGFRVICPDLPGFGESSAIDNASMSAYADTVVGLLDELGIDKAVVGGMSMGGYVLLNMVERYPQRLLGAMYIVTRAAADDSAGKEKRTMLASEVSSGNHLIVPDTFAQVLFAPQTPQEQPELVNEVRQWMESTPSDGIVVGLLAMRDREDYVNKLSKLNIPSLVIGAEQDMAVPVEHAQVLAKSLPNVELIVMPNAGHMANLEQPDTFNQALLGFLQSFV